MSGYRSGKERKRSRPRNWVLFRLLFFVGLGMAIACVLATVGFVVLEAHDQVLRK
jgi:hypothetical protein